MFHTSYKKIVKNPVRFIAFAGSDKVMVVFDDNTTDYHSVVEVTEYCNSKLFKKN